MTRVLLLIIKLLGQLPLSWIRGLATCVSRVLYRTAKKRRHVVAVNLRLCFPHLSEAQREGMGRAVFKNFCIAMLDRAWLWHASERRVRQRLRVVGDPAALAEIHHGQTPIIMFAPHFFGLDAGGTALTLFSDRAATTIYTIVQNPVLDRWICAGRARFGNLTPLRRVDGVKSIISGLRKGHMLYLLPDMDFGPDESIFVPFFGVPAATVPSLARLARLGRAKIIPTITKLTEKGYEVEVLPAWANFPSDDVQADTAHMNQQIETYIAKMPTQYWWVHKRFKTQPEGEKNVYL